MEAKLLEVCLDKPSFKYNAECHSAYNCAYEAVNACTETLLEHLENTEAEKREEEHNEHSAYDEQRSGNLANVNQCQMKHSLCMSILALYAKIGEYRQRQEAARSDKLVNFLL